VGWRVLVVLLFVLDPTTRIEADDPDPDQVVAALVAPTQPPPPPVAMPPTPTPQAWSFAVLSDIHAPNDGKMWPVVDRTVAALIQMKVRAVVITGDFTNGAITDSPARVANAKRLWRALRIALMPLRDARIAVLPVAGNHDSYLPGHRDLYVEAWDDLEAWAQPFAVTGKGDGKSPIGPPFSYGVDIDDVHFTLAHLVDRRAHPDIEGWIAHDLAGAADKKLRFVFGHVPISSVAVDTSPMYLARLGTLFLHGKADVMVFGHEHLVWDEDVAIPGTGTMRQILVGCTSGYYNYGPSPASMKRAHCEATKLAGKVQPYLCRMPNGGGQFVVSRGRKARLMQHARATFTIITVDGTRVTATPMTIDSDGRAVPFYL
jgi:predicted phosphodiesterase